MRAEVGRTEGVAAWAAGAPFCNIVCRRGHKRRLIDRVKWAGENGRGGHLYTAGFRLDDPMADGTDAGTSAELNPITDDYKWRLRCPCGLDVPLSSANLEKLAAWVTVTEADELELSTLAATLSR